MTLRWICGDVRRRCCPILGRRHSNRSCVRRDERRPSPGIHRGHASRLWPEAMTLPEQAMAPNVPTVQCSIRKTTSAETAQDTKPAMQSQATNTVDVDEISGEKTTIPTLRQIATGTQTENRDSLLDTETLKLKETLSEETSSNTPKETMSSGQSQPKDMRER